MMEDFSHDDVPLQTTQPAQQPQQQEEEEKIPEADIAYHDKSDKHGQASWISDVILGGQDGMVNALSVLMGVAAASNDKKVILAAGLAATFAESISMAAVAYTSMLADGDFYKSEREREYRHITKVPNIEKREVKNLFIKMGFQVCLFVCLFVVVFAHLFLFLSRLSPSKPPPPSQGELLDHIVETVTSNPETWVDVMLHEEHNVHPVSRKEAMVSSAYVLVAAIIGAAIPVIPYIFIEANIASWVALAISCVALFAVGAYKAFALKVGNPILKGFEMMFIGISAALIGWGIGVAFNKLWPS